MNESTNIINPLRGACSEADPTLVLHDPVLPRASAWQPALMDHTLAKPPTSTAIPHRRQVSRQRRRMLPHTEESTV
jgi:hypothetical protein